ncbi:MAG TPA: HigA family addiction module antitoxin [Stellaceae bacterium]|nr:HigA family addiction module antitoxin [Stellaceae bacterium]
MAEYPVTKGPAFQPVHPGAILREDVLPAFGLTIKDAAAALGISRQMLHGILAERHAITPEMAVRLGRLCGDGPGIWLRMQTQHDLWLAERQLADEIERIPQLAPGPG